MRKIVYLLLVCCTFSLMGCVEIVATLGTINTDPKLDWYSFDTKNFHIHYHDGLKKTAHDVAKISEDVHEKLSKQLDWDPWGKVHVIVADIQDEVNAKAIQFPYHAMLILVSRPGPAEALSNYEDWLKLVITHEYTHILHMDMAGGLWGGLRYIFGRAVLPSSVIPAWLSEGYATHEESDKNPLGRNSSAYVDMILRMAILEQQWPAIDELTLGQTRWPYGSNAYFVGGRFFEWIKKNRPKDSIALNHQGYAKNPFNFFALEYVADKSFGKSYSRLYRDFEADLRQKYQKQLQKIEKRGLSEGKQLTFSGEAKQGLIYSKDGKFLYYSDASAHKRTRFFKIDASEKTPKPKPVVQRYDFTASDLVWAPNEDKILYSKIGRWRDYYKYSGINAYDLKKNKIKAIQFKGEKYENPSKLPRNPHTSTRRTFNPDMSQDGSLVMVVRGQQTENLWLASPDDQGKFKWNKKRYQWRAITNAPKGTQYNHPRFSPDGKKIVVSTFDPKNRQRDLVLLNTNGKYIRHVTKDPYQDSHPVWDNNGNKIYFVSERTGIFNIFQIDLNKSRLYQVTNVKGGAFSPALAPDGKKLAYIGYQAKGFNIYQIDTNPKRFKLVKNFNQIYSSQSMSSLNAAEVIDPSNNDDPEPKDKKYSPFPEILLPRFIAPNFSIIDDDGLLFGFSTGSVDAIRRHAWRTDAFFRTDVDELGGQFTYKYAGWYPDFFLKARAIPVVQSGVLFVRSPITGNPFFINGQFEDGLLVQRDLIGNTGFSMKLPVRRIPGLKWAPGKHRISTSYKYIYRKNVSNINPPFVRFVGAAFNTPVFTPTEYKASGFSVSYNYNSTVRRRGGISPTGEINTLKDLLSGYSFSVVYDFFNDALGGNWDQQILKLDLRQYRRVPFTDHHVIALRGAGGFTYGDDPNPDTFRLGGSFSEGTRNVVTRNFFPLRGFGNSVSGERVFLLSGEYRFPILRVERGLSTFPVYLKNIHGAFFADYGDAADVFFAVNDGLSFNNGLMGIGGELRTQLDLFYGARFNIRVGYGTPVLFRQNWNFDLSNGEFIFNLGTTF